METLKRDDERDQDALIWQEDSEENNQKKHVGVPESPLRENVAVHRANERRDERGRNGDLDAVPEIRRDFSPGLDEAADIETPRQIPHLRDRNVFVWLHSADEKDVNWHQIKQRENNQNEIEARSAPAARHASTSRLTPI